jgi:SAM-dependent methyltransferase
MGYAIPWPIKIVAKIMLARVPLSYRTRKALKLFRHGRMEDASYSETIFDGHIRRAGLADRTGFTCLELGPEDSLTTAMLAKARGATRCWLVDVGDFADRDMAAYRRMAGRLEAKGYMTAPQQVMDDLTTLLAWCGARYLTSGVEALRAVPSASIDFLFSHAVLEHYSASRIQTLLAEMRRIIAPGGVCSHTIDLRDHMTGALNNLRFSDRVWESEFVARSGFYTNRLRYGEMVEMFWNAGFDVEIVRTGTWQGLPTPRAALAPAFRALPDSDLIVSGFDVLVRPR